MIWHGILNMQETKYGVDPTKEILEDGMKYGFERMCIIHGGTDAMVCFLFMQSCIKNYINVDILTKLYFYVCRGKTPKTKSQNQEDQQNIILITKAQYLLQVLKKWSMHIASVMTTVQVMNATNEYNWMSLQATCFALFVYENQGFCLMYCTYCPNCIRTCYQ